MDNKILLIKGITLLYRESQLPYIAENSNDLVKTVLDEVVISDIGIGINTEREVLKALKDTATEMCYNPGDYEYDKTVLLQRLRVNCNGDERLYQAIAQGIEEDLDESKLKRSIVMLRKTINNHFREVKIGSILSKAANTFRYHRDKVGDVNQFVSEVLAQLEPLQLTSGSKDPAILADIDIGDEGSLAAIFKEVQNAENGSGILRSGWQAFNRMTQGGFRRGEFVLIGALQHKYKTGFTLSLFAQIAMYNTPYMFDSAKKPLLLRLSFEDDLDKNLQFMYQYLRYNETKQHISIRNVTTDEMAAYVKHRLQINGYHVKMRRVDPTQWTYKHICNWIIELEAQGYEIHALMIDYLAMLPTIGCITSGPMGTDLRDMFRRIRNFCAPKKITVITPHQLSTEAKQIIRTGGLEDKFVKDIAEKGYFSNSRQLDTELDNELYIHICKNDTGSYLTVQRGKHRLPTIIPDEDKYFLLKFPKSMPIPDDINGEDSSYRQLPRKSQEDDVLYRFL